MAVAEGRMSYGQIVVIWIERGARNKPPHNDILFIIDDIDGPTIYTVVDR